MKAIMKKENQSSAFRHFIPILFACLLFVCGCSEDEPALYQAPMEEEEETEEETEQESPEERKKRLTLGNTEVPLEELPSYGEGAVCSFEDGGTLKLALTLPDIPRSEDAMVYVFAFEPCENLGDPEAFHRRPLAKAEKAEECTVEWEYEEEQLFYQFVPALRINGRYTPLSDGVYISNPEAAAKNPDGYPEARSKKGLLLDPEMLGTAYLTDLGLQHAIYNIPLSKILGETTDEKYPTITYEYKGKEYKFNGHGIEAYDNLFTYLTNAGLLTTAVILNDWNESYPELIHPLARNKNKKAYYYAFNTSDEEGCRFLEAIASFLMERYGSGQRGIVSSWVIANEINQNRIWNYMNTEDVAFYAAEYEKALRIFYTAAKKNYAGAKVYVSIDHDWNDNESGNKGFFNGRDVLQAINEAAGRKGNYDWGVAIHPYPDPLTKVDYWTEEYEKTMDAPEEVKQGLAFGIYDLEHSPKYIFEVFKDIDTENGIEDVEFMLDVIGADSLEEALEWAQ